MAGGFAKDGAVQEQIDASINDEINRARSRLPDGDSAMLCENCDRPIPDARRNAIKGVRLCVECQEEADRERRASVGYNRRGSKDSQLR